MRASRRNVRVALRAVLCGAIAVGLGSGSRLARGDDPSPVDGARVDRSVRAILEGHGGQVRAGLWVGGPSGPALYSSNADATLPTASAIKTAILIELFARFASALDQPPPGLDALIRDDQPTVAHFTPEQRDEVRRGLAGISVRRLGGIMMGSAPASNIVYNAAASVAIALLGGPEATSRSIQTRDPGFEPIAVRRYMLADRKATGDNAATTAALAAVLQRLASNRVPGISPATVEDIRRAIEVRDDPHRGRLFIKNGLLESDPITVVRTGWTEPAGGKPVLFVVMLAEENPGARTRDQAHRDLDAVGDRLVDVLFDSANPAPR